MMFAAVHPIQMVMGFIIWSLWFVTVYAGLSVACELTPPPVSLGAINWLNGSLLLITLFTALLLIALARRCWRARPTTDNRQFVVRVSVGGYLMAAIATLAVGWPMLSLPSCL
jgi:hypothetical protein